MSFNRRDVLKILPAAATANLTSNILANPTRTFNSH